MRRALALALGFSFACGSTDRVVTSDAGVSVQPGRLDLGTVFLDRSSEAHVTVRNPGRAARDLRLHVPAPFSVWPDRLSLEPSSGATVRVLFAPAFEGAADAVLLVSGEGFRKEVP